MLVPAAALPNGDVCADVPKRPVCGPVRKKKKRKNQKIFYVEIKNQYTIYLFFQVDNLQNVTPRMI